MKLTEKLNWLIEQWCERRELRPLKYLLPVYPGVLAHTDQFGQLLESLKDIKSLCRDNLKNEEVGYVISAINELEDVLKK